MLNLAILLEDSAREVRLLRYSVMMSESFFVHVSAATPT